MPVILFQVDVSFEAYDNHRNYRLLKYNAVGQYKVYATRCDCIQLLILFMFLCSLEEDLVFCVLLLTGFNFWWIKKNVICFFKTYFILRIFGFTGLQMPHLPLTSRKRRNKYQKISWFCTKVENTKTFYLSMNKFKVK